METPAPFELSALQRDWIIGVSGAAFRRRVQRRVATLRALGAAAFRQGVLVAERDPVKFAAAFFAAVYLRVPVALANPRWGCREWGEVAEQLDPAMVFGKAMLAVGRGRKEVPKVSAATILIPTGGSTAGVRFAVHRWDTLVAAAEGLRSFMGGGPLHHACVLPLFHVSGLMQIVRAFVSGGVVAFPCFEALREGRFPKLAEGAFCVSLVSTQLRRLMAAEKARRGLARCRAIFLGGGPVPESLLGEAREFSLPVCLSYGMTETAAMVSVLPSDAFRKGETSAGFCLPHLRVEILAEDGSCRPVGVPGRIGVSGASLFEGYHGQARPNLLEGYRTDDEGYFDQGGRLHVLGRSDRMIVSGGEKIDPLEIEAAILKTGAVEQVLALGWPDDEWGERLVVFYVEDCGRSDAAAWKEDIKRDLANYKVPKTMIPVSKLPINAHGKIDRESVKSFMRGNTRTRNAANRR